MCWALNHQNTLEMAHGHISLSGGRMALYVLCSPMEAKSILNGGMSTNCEGIPSKINFFYLIFTSFKLIIQMSNFII
jgi:hypothetical protein